MRSTSAGLVSAMTKSMQKAPSLELQAKRARLLMKLNSDTNSKPHDDLKSSTPKDQPLSEDEMS